MNELKELAGQTLSGGALKFWEMSFPELIKDLMRQEVLAKEEDALRLHPKFAERLVRATERFEQQTSRVVLNENASLEDIEARAKARAARNAKSATQKREPVKRASKVRPAKRPSNTEAALDSIGKLDETPKTAGKVPPTLTKASPKKLFTSIRMNRLLDRLDNSTLSKSQIGSRLELSGDELDRFLTVCESTDLIRIVRTDLVELHWQGRALARTADAERRMAVLDLVKKLRAFDSESENKHP